MHNLDPKNQRTLDLWSKYPIEIQIASLPSIKEFLPEDRRRKSLREALKHPIEHVSSHSKPL
jgi:hypothetical protein